MNGEPFQRPGRFSDGRTAQVHRVTVRLEGEALEIRGPDGFLMARWALAQIRVEGLWAEKRGLRLRSDAEPAARLGVEDTQGLRSRLAPERPAPGRTISLLVAGLAAALVLAGLFFGLNPASKLLARLVPAGVERQWGESIADAMEAQMRSCGGKQGRRVLDALARRLAEGLPEGRRQVRVRVVRSPDVNALALPGGEVVLFSALIARAQGPDEVAGVLAHELTHIGERHAGAAMIRALGVGALLTMITGDASGVVASGLGMALTGAYSREDEAAADMGGLALLEAADMGAEGMITFFRRLETMESRKGQALAWLSSHPDSGSRAAAIEANRHPQPGQLPALSEADWQAVKRVCFKDEE